MRPKISMTRFVIAVLALTAILNMSGCGQEAGYKPKVGVVYIVHGGFDEYSEAALWDSTLQIFSHDPNSIVQKMVMWNPKMWPRVLQFGNAPKEIGKYSFEIERIGGTDPAMPIIKSQLADLRVRLEARQAQLGVEFVVDYAGWIDPNPAQLADPKKIYNPANGKGSPMTWCGNETETGWDNCNPERYNTDGVIERMLKSGVDTIVAIDLTTSGVRFAKSFDVIRESRALIAQYNAANNSQVNLHWLNDPTDLMEESYPVKPANWTYSLGAPEEDNRVPLEGRPNPVSEDPLLATVHVDGIQQRFNNDIPAAKTGVLLINHSLRHHNQYFDPKVDDTLILNQNIKEQLLANNPGMQAENIVGGWMGLKEINPQIKITPRSKSQLERTRRMRGENLGHAYLYESDEQLPGDEWGYRYWEALEQLKNNGVEHIVVAFPQIMVDSVLNLVEVHNQIGKEIGYKNWLFIDTPDFDNYPGIGHPFADYWGVWVTKECPVPGKPEATEPCCFEMKGCANGQPYPPKRLAPVTKARNDLDPSLAYDISPFGHLGYSPERGLPDDNVAVQAQYKGTWAMWQTPNLDERVVDLLSKHIVSHVESSDIPPARTQQ